MSRTTYISAGSTTQITASSGSLYGVHVTPAAGTQVVAIDSLQAGSITSNFNQDPVGLITRIGPYQASPNPDFIPFYGAHFDTGLVVSATSSARMTVFWSP